GWSEARRQRAARYTEQFKPIAAVTPPVVDGANEPIFHQDTIRVPRLDDLCAFLQARNIGCMIYYPTALHLQPCFADLGYKLGDLPVTEAAMKEVISLPIY